MDYDEWCCEYYDNETHTASSRVKSAKGSQETTGKSVTNIARMKDLHEIPVGPMGKEAPIPKMYIKASSVV